jgi:hypothetical protein
VRAAAPWIAYRPTPISLYGLLAPESSRKQLLRGLCAAREPEAQTLDRHSTVRGSFARQFIGYFPGLLRIALCLRRISPYCAQRAMTRCSPLDSNNMDDRFAGDSGTIWN